MLMPTSRISERRGERWGLWGLVGFTVVALLGYWNFALHPERLAGSPMAVRFFTVSFQFFAQLHILLSALALGIVLVGRLRARWLGALAAVYAVSFLSEHVGTGYGIPFGGYGYTGLLGVKLGGRVPALIPLSWFLMALPSWVLARRAMPGHALRRIALGAFLLVVWDLALDPAMSFLTPYWVWEDSGPYYGMPWVNLLGWFVTGVALMSILEWITPRAGLDLLPPRWMAAYYLAVLLMPLGMLLAAGHVLAVLVTGAGVGLCAWLLRPALAGDARYAVQGEDTEARGRRSQKEPSPRAMAEVS